MATLQWTSGQTGSLGDLLKRLYAPWDIEQLTNLTFPALATMWQEGSAQLGGEKFYFPVRTHVNYGFAYITETGALPTARNTTVVQASVSPTVLAGVVELSGLAQAMSTGDAAAFARAYDDNVSQLLEAMACYKEGVGFRDGTGALATFASGSVATYVFDDVGFLKEGMFVDGYQSDYTTVRQAGWQIKSIDWTTKTVVFEADAGTDLTTGDIIVMAGFVPNGTAGTGNREPIGVEHALRASGTYLGINRSTYDNWKATEITASSAFDERIFQLARVRLTQESGIQLGSMAGRLKLVTHPNQAEMLVKRAIPRVQFSGFSALDLLNSTEPKVGGVPVVTSYQAPAGKAYLGDWNYAKSLYAPNGKLHIDTEYNGSALKWVAGYDKGQVFAKEYCALAVTRPNAFVRIASLTEMSRT